jgi:hypothetical protein
MARSHKAAGAAAQAAKDRQFRAFQEEVGLSLDNNGEVLAPSTPLKAATWHPAAQSPQQRDGGALGKRAAQVEPNSSSLVPIPTLPPHLQMLVSNSLGPAGQDARSTKQLVSPDSSCSPYIKSPPRRSRAEIRRGMWRQAPRPCSPCWTPIFWQWGAQVLSRPTAGRHRSGRRRGLSMRQRHCQRVGVVVVLSV